MYKKLRNVNFLLMTLSILLEITIITISVLILLFAFELSGDEIPSFKSINIISSFISIAIVILY